MKLIVFVTCLFSWFFADAQEMSSLGNADIRCVYQITFRPDSTNPTALQRETAVLLLGRGTSRFQSLNGMQRDSLVQALTQQVQRSGSLNLASARNHRTAFSSIIYKSPQEVTTVDWIGTKSYTYKEAQPFAWQLHPEKRQVAGYSCQRATTTYAGRRFEAWFTREVTLSDGPYKFSGLPGLIVRVADSRQDYVFELTALQKLASPQPLRWPENPPQRTARAAFWQGTRQFAAREADEVAQRATMYGLDPVAQRQRFSDRKRRQNNPLEIRE